MQHVSCIEATCAGRMSYLHAFQHATQRGRLNSVAKEVFHTAVCVFSVADNWMSACTLLAWDERGGVSTPYVFENETHQQATKLQLLGHSNTNCTGVHPLSGASTDGHADAPGT